MNHRTLRSDEPTARQDLKYLTPSDVQDDRPDANSRMMFCNAPYDARVPSKFGPNTAADAQHAHSPPATSLPTRPTKGGLRVGLGGDRVDLGGTLRDCPEGRAAQNSNKEVSAGSLVIYNSSSMYAFISTCTHRLGFRASGGLF